MSNVHVSLQTPATSNKHDLQSDKVFDFLVSKLDVPEDVAQYVLQFPQGLCYFQQNGTLKRLYIGSAAQNRRQVLPPARVTDYLYLSDVEYASNDAWRAKHKITHVVHAMPTCICWPNFDQRKFVEKLDAANLRVCLYDHEHFDQNICKVFQPVIDFIDGARKSNPKARVLVHCAAGVSRSVTLVLAYLMAREQMTLQNAVSHVFSKRPMIDPLWFYIQTLFEFEKKVIAL